MCPVDPTPSSSILRNLRRRLEQRSDIPPPVYTLPQLTQQRISGYNFTARALGPGVRVLMGQSSGWLKPASSQAPVTEEWVQIVRLVKGCGHRYVPHTPALGMGAEAQILDLVLSSAYVISLTAGLLMKSYRLFNIKETSPALPGP